MNQSHLLKILFFVLIFASPAFADQVYTPVRGISGLIYLEEDLSKFLKTHYPEATANNFHEGIVFEHFTGLFIEDAIVKYPSDQKPPQTVVRGPLKGGVWGEIRLQYDEGTTPARQRADNTTIERKHFVEHSFRVRSSLPESDGTSLLVTLRMPPNSTDEENAFIEKLKEHLKNFRLPAPQTFEKYEASDDSEGF